jgi:hypothetical protein
MPGCSLVQVLTWHHLQTHTYTHTHTHTPTHRHTDRCTQTHTHTGRHSETHTKPHRATQTHGERDTHAHTHILTNHAMWGLGLDTDMWGPDQKLLIQLIYSKSAITTAGGSFNRLVSWILIIFKNRIFTSQVRTRVIHTYVRTSYTHQSEDLSHTPMWGPITHTYVRTYNTHLCESYSSCDIFSFSQLLTDKHKYSAQVQTQGNWYSCTYSFPKMSTEPGIEHQNSAGHDYRSFRPFYWFHVWMRFFC